MKHIEEFKRWFNQEILLSIAIVPSACCLSTLGIDGFPNARFLALKDIVDNQFIITGTLSSRKGIEIGQHNKVALSFWWPNTKRQVRIQGIAYPLSDQLNDKYFANRSLDAQIISIVSDQGKEMNDLQQLINRYEAIEMTITNQLISRPKNWGGYYIEPIRIEFLEFKESRFHERKLYEILDGIWEERRLQP